MLQKILKKYSNAILLFILEQLSELIMDYVREKKVEKTLSRTPEAPESEPKKSLLHKIFG